MLCFQNNEPVNHKEKPEGKGAPVMTKAGLETMKKAILFIAAVALILAVVTVIALHRPEPSKINIEKYWTSEAEEYIGAFGFDYFAGQVETEHFPVLLGADSQIVVEDLAGDSSPCRLDLYLDKEQVWSTPVNAGEAYRPGVDPGKYDLVFRMSNGTGKGFIAIEN